MVIPVMFVVIPMGGLWLYPWKVCGYIHRRFVVIPVGGLWLYPWEVCDITRARLWLCP